ncbi:MAG: hypothetical protein VR68_03885 [Peptococcaceae bacterium BRH_c4a]|nr:MAG: hypothetical protein VR68_03885 [Peptococcaceae bacterium BRH_c4a]
MKNKCLLFFFLIFLCLSSPAFAEVILDEGFTDTSLVDLTKTTARVDTVNNCALLPWQSLAGSVNMLENGMGYATASKEGIRLYEYNDATGRAEQNNVYSCLWATDATGVSIRQDNLNVWAITPDSIAYYKFDGAGMSNDPALKTTGLVDVLSVAAYKAGDSALVLQSSGNKAKITRYEAGANLNPALVFQPDITDPVSVSMVNDSPDFRLFTKDSAYYFSYDEAGGVYVEDPARKIAGLSGVISGSGDEAGNSILTNTDVGYYINNDAGGASRVEVLSPGPVNNPVAVSLKPGAYEQVFIDENGNVQWWTYDDAAGSMVRDPNMEISGLEPNKGYAHPRSYHSLNVNTPTHYDAAYLIVAEDKPAGTSVSYYLSSDGGAVFTAVAPGSWVAVPSGSNFVLRAVLDTGHRQKTPRLLHVTLEVDNDMVLQTDINPQPAERGRNVTISARAVRLTTGAVVALDSCSVRYPLETKANGEPSLPGGEFPADAVMVYNAGTGFWEHAFTVPEKSVDGRWADDGVYRVKITGIKGFSQKQTAINFVLAGNIMGRLIIRSL